MFEGYAKSQEEGDIQKAILLSIQARQGSLDSWLDLIRGGHDLRAQTQIGLQQLPVKEEDMEMQLRMADSLLTGSLLLLANHVAAGYLFLIEVVGDASAIADRQDVGCVTKWKNMARIIKLNRGADDEEADDVEGREI